MQPDGGDATASPQENAKRTRRPSVRLHQPYYENPGHRKLQQQWKPKKGATPPRKPRTAKTAYLKVVKNGVVNEKGGGLGNTDFDEDVAIGNWGNFSAANRDRDFKRKRVRSSNSRNAKSRGNGDLGIRDSPLSNSGESGVKELDQFQEQEEGEEEDLGGNGGIDSNLVVADSNPSSPNHSSHDDDHRNHKCSNDNNNVGVNQARQHNKLMDNRHSIEATETEADSNGVRMWLNDLGCRKYVPVFEIHGVDDEVLPLLTLEDLKDMGINEVGVRRKMYSSIQKLDKSFR